MTLLLTVTGADHPGVLAGLCDVLAEHGATVRDVEQVVVHGQLLLGLAVTGEGDGSEVLAALGERAAALEVEVAARTVPDAEPAAAPVRHHVTVLGRPLPPAALAGVARRLAAAGANVERVARLSTAPMLSFELVVSGGDTARLRTELAQEAVAQGVDVAVERASLRRRGRRLVVMDVDSTLVQGEVIEMLAAEAGVLGPVAEVTEAAMRGELDFEQSLRTRVALLAGLPVEAVDRVRAQVRLTPGGRTLVRTLKRLGWAVGVVSGGFTHVVDDLARDLELDHWRANELEVADGALTGRLLGPVVDRAAKADTLRAWAAAEGLTPAQCVAIGDGANDLDMLAAAGLGVAFNAKPVVREQADTALSVPFLDAVLSLLGVPREMVDEDDEQPVASPG